MVGQEKLDTMILDGLTVLEGHEPRLTDPMEGHPDASRVVGHDDLTHR